MIKLFSWVLNDLKFSATLLLLFLGLSGNAQFMTHVLENDIIRSYAIHPTNPDLMLVGIKGKNPGEGRVYLSRDGGYTWSPTFDGKPLSSAAEDVQCVAFIDERTYVAGTWKEGLYMTFDEGVRWWKVDKFPADDIRSIAVDYLHERVYLATTTHGVIKANKDVSAWEIFDEQKLASWSLTYNPEDNHLYAMTFEDGVKVTADNGNSWQQVFKFDDYMIYDLDIAENGYLYLAGSKDNSPTVVASLDKGKHWVPVNKTPKASMCCIEYGHGKMLVGSWDQGVFSYEKTKWDSIPEVDCPAITKIHSSEDKIYYFTWGNGIYIEQIGTGCHVTANDTVRYSDKGNEWLDWDMTTGCNIRSISVKWLNTFNKELFNVGNVGIDPLKTDVRRKIKEVDLKEGMYMYVITVQFTGEEDPKVFKGSLHFKY